MGPTFGQTKRVKNGSISFLVTRSESILVGYALLRFKRDSSKVMSDFHVILDVSFSWGSSRLPISYVVNGKYLPNAFVNFFFFSHALKFAGGSCGVNQNG